MRIWSLLTMTDNGLVLWLYSFAAIPKAFIFR